MKLPLLSFSVLSAVLVGTSALAQPVLGVTATPTPVPGGLVLSLSLTGDVWSLPVGTVIRVMAGNLVISQTIIPAGGRRSATSTLCVIGAYTSGNTVEIEPPDGEKTIIGLSAMVTGTRQTADGLSIYGSFDSTSPVTTFIGGRSVPVVGNSDGVVANVTGFGGWHTITLCQKGSCDTALIRLAGADTYGGGGGHR